MIITLNYSETEDVLRKYIEEKFPNIKTTAGDGVNFFTEGDTSFNSVDIEVIDREEK